MKKGTYQITITEQMTARAVGSGSLDVCATPIVLACMEGAACAAINDTLQDGETTVGTMAHLTHTSPTPVGATIRAIATLQEQRGRLYHFHIICEDECGIIAEGEHTRALVDGEKLQAKANAKNVVTS